MRSSCSPAIAALLISCSPATPAPTTATTTTTTTTDVAPAPTVAKVLPESSCPEPMYDPDAIAGPKTEVRFELHDATTEQLALTGFCILLDGRSIFTMAQMKQALAEGKGTIAWTGPVAATPKHTMNITVAMTGAGSAAISKLKLKLRGERTFDAKPGLVLKIETREEGDGKTPLDTRAVLHVSPMDP